MAAGSKGDEMQALHAPLNNREIRLLDVEPARKLDAQIRASIRTIHLNGPDSFEALSYTWGRSKETRTISISGHLVPVTDNLFLALRRLRLRKASRALWIDAVCINQGDVAERSVQVRMMGEIYNRASRVDVWLGEPTCRRMVNMRILRHSRILINDPSHIVSGQTPGECTWALWTILRGRLDDMESALCTAEPPWHPRAWVAQEFALAQKAQLCFGSTALPSRESHFSYVNAALRYGKLDLPASEQCIASCKSFSLLGVQSTKRHLKDTIRLAGRTMATDPRDKVYSLLGVTSEAEAELIGVDYNPPCQDVFARATHYCCLSAEKDWVNLALVAVRGRVTDNLPSWAIDFACIEHVSNPFISDMTNYRSLEHRATAAKSNMEFERNRQNLNPLLEDLWHGQIKVAAERAVAKLALDDSTRCLSRGFPLRHC